jgi:hypothetical protein
VSPTAGHDFGPRPRLGETDGNGKACRVESLDRTVGRPESVVWGRDGGKLSETGFFYGGIWFATKVESIRVSPPAGHPANKLMMKICYIVFPSSPTGQR